MISKQDEHLSAMIQMCLDAKEPKEELLNLFSDTFKDHWEINWKAFNENYKQATPAVLIIIP